MTTELRRSRSVRSRNSLRREDPQRLQARCNRLVVSRARLDPAAQRTGLGRAERRTACPPHAATWPVGLSTSRLRSGDGGADPAAQDVAGHRLEVEGRIIAAEAQPKAPLAAGVPVAGSHVAARPGEQWHDVIAKADRPARMGVADDHRDLGLGFTAGDPKDRFAVRDGRNEPRRSRPRPRPRDRRCIGTWS